METNRHGNRGGSTFFWGLVIGALLATLLSTKKGRQILRDLTNLSLELFEDFIDEKTRDKKASGSKEEFAEEEAFEDLESEIAEVEEAPKTEEKQVGSTQEVKPNGNGHQKRRLFRGIRRK